MSDYVKYCDGTGVRSKRSASSLSRSALGTRRHTLAGIVATLAVFAAPGGALATETGGSNYPIGVATIVPGFVVGEPGFNLYNYNTYYTADRLNNAYGQRALPEFHADAAVSVIRLDYAPGWQLFGANVGFRLVLPIADITLERQIGKNRQKDSKTGIGDLTIVPLALGWTGVSEFGRWGMGVYLQVVTPTGAYNATDLVNLGRNYTSEIASYAFTLITPTGWNAGFEANYIHNQINPATHYLSGDEFELNYAVGYKIAENITLETNGYYYQQIGKDRRFGAVVGTGNEGRVVAVGPQVRFGLPGGSAIVAKWQHEMAVLNRSEGERFWLQIFVPFGPVKPTAPSNEGDVVRRPVTVAGR